MDNFDFKIDVNKRTTMQWLLEIERARETYPDLEAGRQEFLRGLPGYLHMLSDADAGEGNIQAAQEYIEDCVQGIAGTHYVAGRGDGWLECSGWVMPKLKKAGRLTGNLLEGYRILVYVTAAIGAIGWIGWLA